jgi:hypothetical protein
MAEREGKRKEEEKKEEILDRYIFVHQHIFKIKRDEGKP